VRLTKLELQGFKSFADHKHLVFEPGVTCIVGPNGCGKSNVSDAVRWVLGEQRARAMRGGQMLDVIFQGSSARRPVNVAEVSLHFDNEDGQLPIAYREVVITRRLSRSGESEYLLNRAPCRLRDIHDLLRGTGLGTDAGVIIESRMIDALLSDRPDDRRELFEEAAGVGLYRDRRRSTERRLEETTVDLQRLDDLIGEVQSQVRSLARQRKRAERSAELSARRFTLEIAHAAREMAAWRDELARLESRVAVLREELPAVEDELRAAETMRDAASAARTGAEAQRAELARIVGSQREHMLQLQGEIAVATERQRNAVARRQRAEEERREGEEHGVRLEADRTAATEERAACEARLAEARTQLAERATAEDQARRAVVEARQVVDAAERAERELRDRLRRVELDREGAQREHDEVSARLGALEDERVGLSDALESARREAQQMDEALEAARAEAARAAEAHDRARAEARTAREQDAVARTELLRTDELVTSLQGKANALEALERERVGLAPAAALLLKERDRFGAGAVLGPLSDFISTDAGAALLVERFLGATVNAILVRDREAAELVRRWHSDASPGPLLLLPLDALEDDTTDEQYAGTLAELVRATEPARAWAHALLGHVQAVDGGASFEDARGAIWLPGVQGGPGPLRRRAELADLRAELERAEESRRAASRRADEARSALESADVVAHEASEASAEAQRLARRAEERRGEVTRRVERAERELRDAEALAARLAERLEALARRLAAQEEEGRALAAEAAERDAQAHEARGRLATSERAQEEARELRTRSQIDEAQAQARLQVAADRERRLAEELTTASQRLHTLAAELGTLAQSDSALAGQMASWQLELETRQGTLADGESRLADAEHAMHARIDELTRAERHLEATRQRGHALAEEMHAAQLRYTELSGRRTAIRERLEAEWRKPLDEMLAAATAVEMEDVELRAELEGLREQLDQIGPVNPLAIEEHEEEVRRLDFLTTQRDDLAQAKLSLQQAIREIDATAQELFLATFTQVRENFRQIFMTLFGGGECDLRLENAEQPLDCDIEIHASPRGKRTQRIHLLSSGERNLVALSLLFGIFLTKPSPFCLMDEVDAPLDDQNVGRFVRMLNEFKQQTQFIVITHNPRTTTEAADAVYGVTMQEPGVSTLVSVRMRGNGAAVHQAIAGVHAEPAPAGV
jgi:chromosome segregation protein